MRDAVNVLRDAETRFGPSPALSRDLRSYARALGRTDIPAIHVPTPRTAWEHYELGRSYVRSDEFGRAEQEFQKALEMRPGEFWPYFSQADCAYHLKRYDEAVQLLSICVALAPGTPECYYNRAVAHEALGHTELAKADYTRALELNPRLSDAALNRGVLALHAGRYVDAANDFKRAQRDSDAARPGTRPTGNAAGRDQFEAALAHLARDDWPSARASLRQAAEHGDAAARRLSTRLGLEVTTTRAASGLK